MAAPTRELRKSWGLSRTPFVFHSLFLFSFLSLPPFLPLSLSFSLVSTPSVLARARASTDTYYMDANVGGEDSGGPGWRGGREVDTGTKG